jgi:hypothetical protein
MYSKINRMYSPTINPVIDLYGGENCGCSDCLDGGSLTGGRKMLPNPLSSTRLKMLPKPRILPYPDLPACDCSICESANAHIMGGNIFDTLANAMPSILKYVPIFGPLLSGAAEGTLEILDPYRKNPRNPRQPSPPTPPPPPKYQPIATAYTKAQQDIISRLNPKRGGRNLSVNPKKGGAIKKGSIEAKEKMAYLRSLRKN